MKREINWKISVIEPLGEAFDRTAEILFRPFRLEKWLIIGFCAWLALLGNMGGGGGGGRGRFGGGFNPGAPDEPVRDELKYAVNYVVGNLAWIIPVACVAIVAVLLIWLVLTWLSSRGHFMFLHCVAGNKAEVKVPWREFRSEGNSLFVFRVVLGLIAGAIIAVYIVAAGLCVAALVEADVFGLAAAVVTAAGVFGLILLVAALAVIKKLTLDFVVPVMFLRRARCMAGWREFMEMLSARKGVFCLYILFQIVIAIAVGAIVLTAGLVTCCCAWCLLAIPYIGTVVFLPVLVFKRAYSVCFLRQFGPEFDVFAVTPEPSPEIAGESVQ